MYHVNILQSSFGPYLDIQLTAPIIVLVRTNAGYHVSPNLFRAILPHQVYIEDIEEILKIDSIYEIVALSFNDGRKKTLWAQNKNEILYP